MLNLDMQPDPAEAKVILETALRTWFKTDTTKSDLVLAMSEAVAALKGYSLPDSVVKTYICSICGAHGVKLWRGIGSTQEAWCARCGMEQAGLPDVIDADGRHEAEYGDSDQIYSSAKGQNLLPWVPREDGETWGYTSVPPEGCRWWRLLPTR